MGSLDHLEEAKKYAAILVRHAPRRMSAWALQYDVSIRRGKMLLALQSLFKMKSIDPNDHRLFTRTVDYSQKLSCRASDGQEKRNAPAEEVISSEFPNLMSGKSLADFVRSTAEGVRADESASLPMRVAVARAMLATGSKEADASSLILESELNVRCVTVETCREALKFVESLGGDSKERLMGLVVAKFPFSKDLREAKTHWIGCFELHPLKQ